MSRADQIRNRYDGLMIDLDGVVWLDGQPLPGAIDTLLALRSAGTRIVFLTNDPRSTRHDLAGRLTHLGFPTRHRDVVSSGSATAEWIRSKPELVSALTYVVGAAGLKMELATAGVIQVSGPIATHANLVVVGGHEAFDYDELRMATVAVHCGAMLVATNRDMTFPAPGGPMPATGAILAAVEAATGREAICIGKPEPHLFEAARPKLAGCRRVAVVGDAVETDIAGGKAAGLETVLVMTGKTGNRSLASAPVQPDHIAPSLSSLRPGG